MSFTRQTAGGFNLDETPYNQKYASSVSFAQSVGIYQAPRSTADPCGTGELAKINTALNKFFIALKGIKKYGELYINGTINRIQNVTSLIRNISQIISGILKTLMSRLRDFLIDKIRTAIEAIIDIIFPTIARQLQNTIVQQIIDQIFCAFKSIVGGLKNLVTDFLSELVGKVVNVPFCAAEQFTNALVNNIASIVDTSIGPILDQINDVLGGVGKVVGSVFEALDFILGFQGFLCAKPKCPKIKEFKASPWGGPTSDMVDDFNNFLPSFGGSQTPTVGGIVGSVDNYISDFEIFGSRIGDSPSASSSITQCDPGLFDCGPPKVSIFGGGGSGALGEVIVDNIGRSIGVNLISGGSGYTRPPFVSFSDSCGDTFTGGYTIIDNFGQVVDVVMTTTPVVPPIDGTFEDNPGGTGGTGTDGTGGTGTDGTGGTGTDGTGTDGNLFGSDYIVCIEGFRVISTGIGYTTDDIFVVDPDIPNLEVSVKLTETGQVIDVQISERICGLSGYPEATINSETGDGVIIEPILSFIKINEFSEDEDDTVETVSIDVDSTIRAEISTNNIEGLITTLRGRKILTEKQQFTRKSVIKIVDCIT